MNPWRVGRKLGRTIYIQGEDFDPNHDHFVAIADTPDLAEFIVKCVNICLDAAAKSEKAQANTGG